MSKVRHVHIDSSNALSIKENVLPAFIDNIRRGLYHTDVEFNRNQSVNKAVFIGRPPLTERMSCFDSHAWIFSGDQKYLAQLARLSVAFRAHIELYEAIHGANKQVTSLSPSLQLEVSLLYPDRGHKFVNDAVGVVKGFGYRNEFGSVAFLSLLNKSDCVKYYRVENPIPMTKIVQMVIDSIIKD